jgi:hypothetical protein
MRSKKTVIGLADGGEHQIMKLLALRFSTANLHFSLTFPIVFDF